MKLWIEVLDTTNGAGTYVGVFDETIDVPDHIPASATGAGEK
jgi:hypothetical protein